LYCRSCEKNELYVNWQPLPDSINMDSGNNTAETWKKESTVTVSAKHQTKLVVFQVSVVNCSIKFMLTEF
jgi:hypothetical protein